MKRIHVIGRKNHGKTTLVAELVAHLTAAGCRVGTIKHTHHLHELDTPGKDSHRHRQAGACAVGILTRGMNAVFWEPSPDDFAGDRYQQFDPHFAGCDLVIVEGDVMAAAPKIEVWRQSVGSPPIASEDSTVVAVVTDDVVDAAVAVWPRRDVATTAANVLRLLGVERPR